MFLNSTQLTEQLRLSSYSDCILLDNVIISPCNADGIHIPAFLIDVLSIKALNLSSKTGLSV